MTIDFYYLPGSAPCRAVQMTAKALGVELNCKLLNLMTGEHLTPEFIKINPQHTIPTLVDNGFTLWESRPIMIYLFDKYGKNDSLYPKDPQKRAVVNQRLFFDLGTLYQNLIDYYFPIIWGQQSPNPEKFKKIEASAEFFNTFLEGNTYAAGDSLTLADITLVATISTCEVIGLNLSNYPNIERWYEKCKATTPGYDLNEAGIRDFKMFFESKLKQ